MVNLILFASLAIGVSFLCSILEAAFLSIPSNFPSILRQNNNEKLAAKLELLKENIDESISSILTLNTVAHTAGAAGVGASASTIWGSGVLGIVSAVMTFAILVFSEVIPKTLGANNWRSLTPFVVSVLILFNKILKPINIVLSFFTSRFSKKEEKEDYLTELKVMVDLAYEDKAINEDTRKILQNALNLKKYKVGDIMTPESVVKTLPSNMTIEEFHKTQLLHFSRYPIYDDEKNDDIFSGFIHKSDIFNLEESNESQISEYANELKEFETDVNIELVMHYMLTNNLHMIAVRDSLGTFRGLVTLEDILETILGKEIKDETDNVLNMRKYAQLKIKKRKKNME